MEIDGAIVTEQGLTFAVVIVKQDVIDSPSRAAEVRTALATIRDFNGLPLVLAAQRADGGFRYLGRDDIGRFLESIDPRRIPWKRFSVSR